jgi:hypothetical protein
MDDQESLQEYQVTADARTSSIALSQQRVKVRRLDLASVGRSAYQTLCRPGNDLSGCTTCGTHAPRYCLAPGSTPSSYPSG